ncbi:MAG TPA: Stp1/IreP family PP2C-type Ser/Thr phosphatase [Deltaproteobacteria bacterium]|nr:Stp1/IreP family PP2C-type Ser/Thr phosphatase [Deltaproteobacteria bacterium]
MNSEIFCFGKSDTGLIRKNNEDSFLIDPRMGFCTVADGMGGAAAGEVASNIFVETASQCLSLRQSVSPDHISTLVQKTFSLANQRILEHVQAHPDHNGMGCTAELLAFSDTGFVLGHMGDSRTYRMRNLELKQLSKDHSLVQDQLDQGLITSEQAQKHPHRNVILRAVGISDSVSLDLIRGKTYPGDLFLLCSDGLTDMVSHERILEELKTNKDLPELVDILIDLAKQAGGKDNITVVLARTI